MTMVLLTSSPGSLNKMMAPRNICIMCSAPNCFHWCYFEYWDPVLQNLSSSTLSLFCSHLQYVLAYLSSWKWLYSATLHSASNVKFWVELVDQEFQLPPINDIEINTHSVKKAIDTDASGLALIATDMYFSPILWSPVAMSGLLCCFLINSKRVLWGFTHFSFCSILGLFKSESITITARSLVSSRDNILHILNMISQLVAWYWSLMSPHDICRSVLNLPSSWLLHIQLPSFTLLLSHLMNWSTNIVVWEALTKMHFVHCLYWYPFPYLWVIWINHTCSFLGVSW